MASKHQIIFIAKYFGAEFTPSDKLQSFTCPHCAQQGIEYKDLLSHVEMNHTDTSDFLVVSDQITITRDVAECIHSDGYAKWRTFLL